jgi:hypothetical protein
VTRPYSSPWYTGQESGLTPEPGAHRQWREARQEWLRTSRHEDFERMLASVTPENPPLASDVQPTEQARARPGQWAAGADVAAVAATAAASLAMAVIFTLALILALMAASVKKAWPGPGRPVLKPAGGRAPGRCAPGRPT